MSGSQKKALSHSTQPATSGHNPRFWSWKVLLAAIALSYIAFDYSSAPSNLPEAYALCSRGRKIYTVDSENTLVECILVNGTRVVDSGDLGMSPFTLIFLLSHTPSYSKTTRDGPVRREVRSQRFYRRPGHHRYIPTSSFGLWDVYSSVHVLDNLQTPTVIS